MWRRVAGASIPVSHARGCFSKVGCGHLRWLVHVSFHWAEKEKSDDCCRHRQRAGRRECASESVFYRIALASGRHDCAENGNTAIVDGVKLKATHAAAKSRPGNTSTEYETSDDPRESHKWPPVSSSSPYRQSPLRTQRANSARQKKQRSLEPAQRALLLAAHGHKLWAIDTPLHRGSRLVHRPPPIGRGTRSRERSDRQPGARI